MVFFTKPEKLGFLNQISIRGLSTVFSVWRVKTGYCQWMEMS